MHRPSRFVLALSAALALGAAPAGAGILVAPDHPVAGDSLHVTTWANYSMMCWWEIDTTCELRAPDTLAVTARVQYCSGAESCPCPMMPVALARTCTFAPLPAGSYTVLFTEVHVNPYDPRPSVVETLTFSVGASTPTVRRAWGALKAIYR